MRPIRITMQAFASYGKETTIDLTKPDQNLFLITGDTGAGKTTIFDAIVFALYGEASSGNNRKDGEELQSQYTPLSVRPFVELEFSEQTAGEEQVYIVRRTPRHQRMLLKGKGTTIEKESVSLTLPDGLEFSSNARETDEKIQQIVGLTKDQFMQVAMIAQGEFMELLRAKSDDRKLVFRKLFRTGFYQDIVDELARRKKEKAAVLARHRTVCQTITANVVIPPRYERAAEMQELQKRIIQTEGAAFTVQEDLLSDLKKVCEMLGEDTAAAKERSEKTEKLYISKRDEHTAAVELLNLFRQQDQAEKILEECRKEEQEILEDTENIRKIGIAYDLANLHQRYQDSKKLAGQTANDLKDQEDRLPELQEAREETSKAEKHAGEVYEEAAAGFSRVEEKVTRTENAYRALAQAKKDLEIKKRAAAAAADEEKNAADALTDLEGKEQEWRTGVESRKDADKNLELWKVRRREADAAGLQITALAKLEKDTNAAARDSSVKAELYRSARDAFTIASTEYQLKQNQFLDSQAGFLAARLEEGKPCPVCGSISHPSPCVLLEEHKELTRELLDQLSSEVTDLSEKQKLAAEAAGSAGKVLEERSSHLKTQAHQLQRQLEGMFAGHPDHLQELAAASEEKEYGISAAGAQTLLEKWISRLEKEGLTLRREAEELHKLQQLLEGIDERKAQLKETALQAAHKAVEAKTAAAGAESALSQQQTEALRDYPSLEVARGALKAAEKSKQQAENASRMAKEDAQKAASAADKTTALIRRYKEQLPQLKEQEQERLDAYEKMLADKDMTETEWKLLTARFEKEDAARLQAKVGAHDKKRAAAEAANASARQAIAGRPRPVPEILREQMQEASLEREAAAKAYEICREQQRIDQKALEALEPEMESRKEVQKESSRLESMYSRLAGKMTGARMDIETFVQRYYLERILRAANRRFLDMTKNQFELRMYDSQKAGEGKNHGLDLMVYSTVTGKEREARTLSGGESFMAALSLALGMADQIQESSSSLNLDVMFIDEGFGSLDDHSRNQAVKVLKQMAGGSRLIGIISHVTELKQEIEDQLIVTKDEEGSHVKWQIS